MQISNFGTFQKFWSQFSSRFGKKKSYNTQRFQHTFSSIRRFSIRAEPAWNDGNFSASQKRNISSQSISSGRGDTSWSRSSDGHTIRTARGRGDESEPNFNVDVPPNGYAWWYIDGIEPNSGQAVSIIAFIGSVFSPWYRWSGRKQPQNNVCLNVATYGKKSRFTMTDRGQSALVQEPHKLTIGPSSLIWDPSNKELIIQINEVSSLPLISRLKGTIRLKPSGVTNVELPLTKEGTHIWRPFAPTAEIEVNLNKPEWQWKGHGYFDANFGTRALEQDFDYWTWGRFPLEKGTSCFYDLELRNQEKYQFEYHFENDGTAKNITSAPKNQKFSNSLWGIKRQTRCDSQSEPKQENSLLDAPFYNRAAVSTTIKGRKTTGVFEALDLRRFRNPLLMFMLAVRVPRRKIWKNKV